MKAASLNHVYRLIWSKLQQAWVAVAETARAHGKSSVSGQVGQSILPVSRIRGAALTSSTKWCLVVASAFAAALASPSSFADTNQVAGVIAGDLTVKDLSATHTQYIHTANVNIVDFYKFGVMKGNQLDVIMPDAGRALYRVIGNSRSEIMGTLNSNGSLFLINQNGVLFGQGSEVNVGNIVASSMDITNDAFLQGKYNFSAGNILGTIENRGVIKAQNEGYIVLLGNTVDNSGTLVASNGSVVLGSAQQATLDFFGNGLVKAKLSGDALEATVKNSGFIQADGGLVQLATNARSAAINISGIVEANQLVERDGVIRLEGGDNAKVEVSGQLIAKGQNTTGGTIEVTGEQVALMNGALLDASGDTGGGTVLVGGDYQGKNNAVYNSRTAYISSGATIKADATQEGNGGKVIVWADDLTRYYGNISAQGGLLEGNGGFVEVSGKQNLAFQGKVNVGAENGLGGTVLLDPENIILNSTVQVPPTDHATGTPDIAFADNTGLTTTVNVSDVTGFAELFLQANNDITVDSALNMTDLVGSIRLEANHDIHVNANVSSGIFGSVQMNANNDINIAADVTSGIIGTVNLKADADNSGVGNIAINGNITGSAGVTLSAINITQSTGSINTTGNTLLGLAGDVKIDAKQGNVTLGNINANGTTIGASAGARGGKVEIDAKSLTVGNINTAGSASGNTVDSGGQGGEVVITTANDAIVGNIITSSGDAGVDSAVSRLSGEVKLTSTAGNITTGDINANGGANGFGAHVVLNANGTNGSVVTGNINTSAGVGRADTDGKSAGKAEITADGNITTQSIVTSGADGNGANKSGGAAGAVTLNTANGNISVGAINVKAGDKTGTGTEGDSANVFVKAGADIVQNGNILTTSKSADAVTLVAGRDYKNPGNYNITTGVGGRWLIYSTLPKSPSDIFGSTPGTWVTDNYTFKQYGKTYGDSTALAETGSGLIYSGKAEITPTLTGTTTKVYDTGTNVTNLAGLAVDPNALDGDTVTLSPLTSATYSDKNVGTGKEVTSNSLTLMSATNNGRKVYGYTLASDQAKGNVGDITPASIKSVTGITANDKVFDGTTFASLNTGNAGFNGILGNDQLIVATANGAFQDSAIGNNKQVDITGITLGGQDAGNYVLMDNTAQTTASILPLPTINGFASPRDDAGLGGLIPNNPALNTMFIVSLNPAAGDEEDLDAVACPTNEDSLGSTPILNSGVKLPDGVNSNCI